MKRKSKKFESSLMTGYQDMHPQEDNDGDRRKAGIQAFGMRERGRLAPVMEAINKLRDQYE